MSISGNYIYKNGNTFFIMSSFFCMIDSDTDLQMCFTNFSMPLSLQPLLFQLSPKFLFLIVPTQKLIHLCNGLEIEWVKTEWVGMKGTHF